MNKFTSVFKGLMSKVASNSTSSIAPKLFDAYQNQNKDKLQEILSKLGQSNPKAFLDCKHSGLTLLHHAVYDENIEVVQMMKKWLPYFNDIVDEDVDHEEGWTPLLLSACKANLDIMKLLIRSGAKPLRPKNNGATCYHFAASNNDIHMLNYLIKLDMHFTIDMEDGNGWTPAISASYLNNMDSLNLLIENGADLTHSDKSEYNAYEHMVSNDLKDMLEINIQGAMAYQKTRSSKTSGQLGLFHLACINPDGSECLTYLLKKAKDEGTLNQMVNQINNENDKAAPLHYAILSCKPEKVKLLLRYMGETPANQPKAKDLKNTNHYQQKNQ